MQLTFHFWVKIGQIMILYQLYFAKNGSSRTVRKERETRHTEKNNTIYII